MITVNILIYNNLIWINPNLITVAYKNFTPVKAYSLPSFCAIILQIMSLHCIPIYTDF